MIDSTVGSHNPSPQIMILSPPCYLHHTSFQDYALYQERNTDLYCRVALATLLVYYTVLTFGDEINLFWTHFKYFNCVFILNRYIGLLSVVIEMQLLIFTAPEEL
ncbi:hypothetical protein PNOK_0732600 [Pyrrhoderma noxium]|uniref:DUF6533 domain-containing protein n=1 Tax=Pyrrhoderma noxium TaxID=2282107 RepID=A0A286UCD2_9AGAM|nr:hypothetical protein PNOK_0732600 [Pyrrhoderma noxium]